MGTFQSQEDKDRNQKHQARLAAQRELKINGGNQMKASRKMKKLKLLCLCGNRSNSEVTELQVGFLGLDGTHDCDITFLDGPIISDQPYAPEVLQLSPGPFASWCTDRDFSAEGLRQGVAHLEAHVASTGPYDGIFGFSAGATVATIASAKMEENRERRWQFVIVACGASTTDMSVGPVTAIASFHLIGGQDQIKAEQKPHSDP